MADGRTLADEPMDEDHRKILKSVKKKLVKDMDPEEVLLWMSGSHLLSERDEERIKARGLTREEQCNIILEMIPRRGAKAYDIFKEAINNVHPHLTSTILKAENEILGPEHNTEQSDTTQTPQPINAENLRLTSKHIKEIKDDVGMCWLDLGIELEIEPEAKIHALERDCNFSRDRAHKVLQMWKDQKASDATVGRLASALTKIGHKGIAEKLLRLA
ncbi:THO complex subunit 1-like [Oculina patagonica]